ncbi:MAG TPA: carboxypeptidase-like regulatory domain-containing protein [Bryobacteraceae bacterium]|nr:carboxypeptidase-like regulatory domain-containing protein [Bryobacteraceae bacterium]
MRTRTGSMYVLALTVCLAVPLRAQETASINGRVVDPSGAAVPGVAVSIEEVNTKAARATKADEGGRYNFPNVAVGTYQVTAEAAGFKKTVVPDVRAEVAQSVRLDLTLELGALSERVEVSAVPAALQMADSQIGGVVENKAIADLPLNGRSYTQLMVLMAGAVEGPQGARAGGAYARKSGGLAFNVNGQRATANSFLIDGMLAKEVQHSSTSLEPIIDALAEFRVQTSNYTAEFGTEAGGQINAVIKSGTNALHGALWNFFRNDKLDGNNFFSNRAGTDRPAYRRNQFGAAAGGPIILPGYDGRNRTFIFGAYEGTRISKGITQLTTVPNAALRSGDLSSLGPVTDPLTGVPFPGNVIPPTRIHPIIRTMLDQYTPLPNSTGTFNWISNDPNTNSIEACNWRLDHRFSNRDSIFGHYLYQDTDYAYPRLFPTDGTTEKFRGQHLVLGWTHLVGSRTLNEFRTGFSRFSENQYKIRQNTENVTEKLGMKGLCALPSCWILPIMSVTGFASIGEHGGQAQSAPRAWRNEFYQWSDSIYHTTGAHNIRTGITVRRHRDNFPEAITPQGTYSFNGFLTGQPFGDFLLGYPRVTDASIDIFSPHFRYTMVEPWVQDDWRISSELTLNFGLRYEWMGRPVSKDGTVATILFENGTATQVTGKNPGKLPPSLAYNDNNNFAPRVGFAYSPKALGGRTVIRSAYGVFYQRETANTWIDLAINTPFITQTRIQLDTTPSSPFYFAKYSLYEPIKLATPQPLLIYAMNPEWEDTQVQQWNFNVQQSLPAGTVLQVAYIGNHAGKLPRGRIPNQPRPGPGPVQPRRPYQNFGLINGIDSFGNSSYHGLQVQFEKRYSSGLQFMSAYTFSKCLDNTNGVAGSEAGVAYQDDQNFRANRGRCTSDSTHRYSLSWVYDLPFGRGKPLLGSIGRGADLFVGGWQINGIITLRTGQPFTVTVPGDPSNTSDGPTFADLIGDPNKMENRTVDRFFNTSAFARPDNFRFGTSGRNVVTGPGVNNWDISVFKNFNVDEIRKVQFRAEFFNIANHPQFALPGASYGTAQFGTLSSLSKDPRDVQLSLKFLF